MKDKTWTDILHWKELIKYLTINEIIELSIGCKILRIKTNTVIFKNFNFNSFTITNNYKSYIISYGNEDYYKYNLKDKNKELKHAYICDYSDDEAEFDWIVNPYKPLTENYIESKARFKNDVMLYCYHPKRLNITFVDDYFYLLDDLSNVFHKINTLIIHKSSILFENFQNLLDNLSCLEVLEFIDTVLLKCIEHLSSYSINWPNSLKKLRIGTNIEGRVDGRDLPISKKQGESLHVEYHIILLESKHLPELLNLEIELSGDRNADDKLLDILKLNPQIRSLKISLVEFKQELFDIMKSFHYLTHLELFCSDKNHLLDFGDMRFPVLAGLKDLSLKYTCDPVILHSIAQKFPNIVNLSIDLGFIEFEELCLFAYNMPNFLFLKNLKLIFNLQSFGSDNISFAKLDNLESLQIVLGNLSYIEKIKLNVEPCQKLKCVRFACLYNYVYFGKPSSMPLLESDWNLVYFPHKFSFYRVY